MEYDHSIWGRAKRGVPKDWPMDDEGKPECPSLVTNLPEGGVSALTRNMLEAYGIPVLEIYQEDGAFARVLFGSSAYGVGLFVPASRQEEARALLEAVPGDETGEGPGVPDDGRK